MIDDDDVQEIFEQYLSCTPEQRELLNREISSLLEYYHLDIADDL
jgi:hypothetical protein